MEGLMETALHQPHQLLRLLLRDVAIGECLNERLREELRNETQHALVSHACVVVGSALMLMIFKHALTLMMVNDSHLCCRW